MNGKLTTHVLDLMNGIPAEGLNIDLWKLEPERTFIKTVTTNSDGRVDSPLLCDEQFNPGEYELVFYVADYFKKKGVIPAATPFLDQVPVRFGISDMNSHYHVPLLVAPGGYSTYRGS
ncbi:hydroxyisourate hydrolase [Bacillus thermophilus]|uniref:5-hydroxyisourate hydrolase n=1 Tax=Siminovitchia thermophila TaxID=1245522 RepID=A0ABS2R307_9BACI|nr:hydroxyisourate hydrolase [Siminovitchia thermophila]MBM7714027.1 hydroxyisourate hydrolase [Siminovitchia thermophila]